MLVIQHAIHTFFEMLEISVSVHYFKREAIGYAWTFLTETLQLPKEKLWVTVFEEDDEAYEIWRKRNRRARKIGLAALVPKITFWQMARYGPMWSVLGDFL